LVDDRCNVLGLLQSNVKRTLAYSSIAHTGYMLVEWPRWGEWDQLPQRCLVLSRRLWRDEYRRFGVLMLLPSRDGEGSAETFDDLAGQGRRTSDWDWRWPRLLQPYGIPLTAGFAGNIF